MRLIIVLILSSIHLTTEAQADSLKAFITSQETLESVIHSKLDLALKKIDSKLSENDSIYNVFNDLAVQSKELQLGIEELKTAMILLTDSAATRLHDISNVSNHDAPKKLMITNNKGKVLKKELAIFNNDVLKILSMLDQNSQIDLISLEGTQNNSETVSWERSMFENTTITAAHSILSTLQIDIKNILLQTGKLLYKL